MTALICAATASLAAVPADSVRSRVAGYRALGAAMKGLTEGVRQGDAGSPRLQAAARDIVAASKAQYRWFPQGSGPQPGVKTAARAEIWGNAPAFRTAQDNFARQATAVERAVAAGDASALRGEIRKLGGACKACHDQFRTSDD
ncbi:c-type cytochrome [Sphingobium sufflavum]|uniref:c-type cytochrome n=1 Tax=Sphingobium sufflavum TaxID=1129547 RepID=UPI001F2A031C|nr:cytochrome c [Sphingobium sufflavum]